MLPNNDKKKNQIEVKLTVNNEVKLDPINPIPIQYGGDSFYVVTGKKYIPFLGKSDNLATLFLEARLTSTTQNACITSISNSVVGKGLTILENETPNEDFIKWLGNVNNQRQTFDDVLLNVVDGERTHGNQFVEIQRLELSGKKYIKVYLHPMQYCRLAEPPEGTDTPDAVLISKLFAKKGFKNSDYKLAKKIPLWSENSLDKNKCWLDNKDGTFSTMLHLKNEVSGIDYYGMPASVAGLRYQVLEGKAAQYNIDNFDNNMVLGGMLVLKSAMTTEEAQLQAKEIMLSHIGQGKTGRIAVISSESGLDDVKWIPYETQKDGSFIELDKRIEAKIIAANGWDAMLAGIHESGGSLGKGSGYVRAIYDIKESVLLNPLRKRIIEKIVNPIVKIYADWFSNKEIEKYKFAFQSSMPFSFMGDIDPETFIKVKEARALGGFEVDETNGDKYLSEMTSKQKNVQTEPIT